MAGSLLDDLVDVFSDDEAVATVAKKDAEIKETPYLNAEEYLRRAVNMVTPHFQKVQTALQNPTPQGTSDTDMTPEEQADYVRRMVHMREMAEMTPSPDQENKSSTSNLFLDGLSALGGAAQLKVCAEYRQSGGCRAGVKCGFVHEAPRGPEESNGKIKVDPNIFDTHSLQLPGCCKREFDQGVTLLRDPYWAGW